MFISVCYGGDDGRSGGRVVIVRESATSLTSGSQKPIGSHLLPQPPCWFGELRRTSPPSHDYYFMRSKEVKKKRGARARRASGYRMLCGAAGPPRSN